MAARSRRVGRFTGRENRRLFIRASHTCMSSEMETVLFLGIVGACLIGLVWLITKG